MKYDTFKKVILERLEYDIPDPKKISIQTIYKNNGLQLDGLVIMEDNCNISPTLYLNYYFDSYQNGTEFSKIYDMILENYRHNRPTKSIDVRFFTQFENTKSKIAIKLINYEKNKTLLQDVPHIRFLDLAIVFYCLITMDEEVGNATILIHNSHLAYWNVTLEELFAIAKENTRKLLPEKISDMNDMLQELSKRQLISAPMIADEERYPMFVLTNERNLHGAACILYDDLLKQYATQADTDFYILPSSIHEVILIPTTEDTCQEELSEMVMEVNASQLLEEEVLSDHAYYYSRKTNEITM
jgi:hypothetical protein